jgi:hypothetical protein
MAAYNHGIANQRLLQYPAGERQYVLLRPIYDEATMWLTPFIVHFMMRSGVIRTDIVVRISPYELSVKVPLAGASAISANDTQDTFFGTVVGFMNTCVGARGCIACSHVPLTKDKEWAPSM